MATATMFTNVDDVLERISAARNGAPALSSEELFDAVECLAQEVKQLRRNELTNKLLIEHEENVRTIKSSKKPDTRPKPVPFQVGDRIKASGAVGTIRKKANGRVQVEFDDTKFKKWFTVKQVEWL